MTSEPTPQQRDAFCEWFAVAFGEQMSRLARERFPSDGRGAVTVRIDEDFRVWRHNNEAAAAAIGYLGEREARSPGGPGWPAPDVAGMVARYDPGREFVAVFRLGGAGAAFIVRMVETPR
jgi:hypothetical protein